MSIIVKGMKMPENCIKCPLQFGGWCYASPPEIDERVAPTVDEAWEQGKPEWCPLVALPDKHGRLVDADALIADCQLAQKQADRHGREFANAFYSGGGEVSTEWWCVEDMIENAPTIEPERKKGKWIHDGYAFKGGIDWMHCSECGHKDSWNVATRTPFCAWCGAKMDGKDGADDKT